MSINGNPRKTLQKACTNLTYIGEETFHSWSSPRHCKALEAVLWPKLIAIRSLAMTMFAFQHIRELHLRIAGNLTNRCWDLQKSNEVHIKHKNHLGVGKDLVVTCQVPRKSLSIAYTVHMAQKLQNECCHEVQLQQGSIVRFQTNNLSPCFPETHRSMCLDADCGVWGHFGQCKRQPICKSHLRPHCNVVLCSTACED